MTFDERESSPESATPVSLYLITYGAQADDHYAYTDNDESIVYRGVIYEPVAIGRNSVQAGGNLEQSEFLIDIDPNAHVVDFLRNRTPTEKIRLEVRQGHADDPDGQFVVVWTGFVSGTQRKGMSEQISGELLTSSLARPGLRRQYQRGCAWALYEPHCNAARTVRATAVPVVIGDNLVVLAAGWNGSLGVEKFKGGYVSWQSVKLGGTHIRTIIDVLPHDSGETLVFQGDTDGLEEASPVRVFAGCNHQLDDCQEVHNNIVNYGGQPNIPRENPVGVRNRFY